MGHPFNGGGRVDMTDQCAECITISMPPPSPVAGYTLSNRLVGPFVVDLSCYGMQGLSDGVYAGQANKNDLRLPGMEMV